MLGAIPLSLLALGVVPFGRSFYRFDAVHWHAIAAGFVGLLLVVTAAMAYAYEHKVAEDARIACQLASAHARAIGEATETQSLLQQIIDEALVGMAFYRSDDGQCVVANPALARMIGATVEQTKAQRFRELASWRNSGLLDAAELVLESGLAQRLQLHLSTTFEREIDLECLISRVTLAGVPHLSLMLQDVTERVRVEARIRQEAATTQRYLEALRRSQSGLVELLALQQFEHESEQTLLDRALALALRQTASEFGCIMCRAAANPEAEFVSASCILGQSSNQRLVPGPPSDFGPWQEVLRSRKPVICNHSSDVSMHGCRPTALGQNVNRFIALPVVVHDVVVAMVGVGDKSAAYDELDIVQLNLLMESVWKSLDRRRAGDALDAVNRELRTAILKAEELAKHADNANRAKSTFLANMSHEIRTPMNAVLGFAELMQDDENLTRIQRDNLATIRRSGTALLDLINDVLEVSKIEAGHQAVRPGHVDLVELGSDLHKLFCAQAKLKGLSFAVNVDSGAPRTIVADEGKLRQILVNLIGNALKFTREGEITVCVRSEGAELEFRVADTGVGIEPDALQTIFTAFTQGRAGESSHQGTGLGLTLCRMLAKLHGGDVSVTSEVGKGSVFTVRIPLQTADPASIRPKRAELSQLKHRVLAPGQPQRRVLIADDNPVIQTLLKLALEPIGFELYMAADGEKALDIYRRILPDFVLMDMRMPKMDGCEVVREIQRLETSHRATIVGITGDAFEENRQFALQNGFDEFIPKPFHLAQIYAMFERHRGVRFVEGATRASSAAPAPVSMRRLPSDWWDALDEATALGDVARIQFLADAVQTRAPGLAAELRTLVGRFDLRGISDLIHRGSGPWLV